MHIYINIKKIHSRQVTDNMEKNTLDASALTGLDVFFYYVVSRFKLTKDLLHFGKNENFNREIILKLKKPESEVLWLPWIDFRKKPSEKQGELTKKVYYEPYFFIF